jgi:hypothetical protein
MRRKTVFAYDDLDSRRELWRLLGDRKMTDRRRIDFVRWCCQQVNDPLVKVKPAYKDGGYTITEAVADISMLTLQYRGDIDIFLEELVRRVKRL